MVVVDPKPIRIGSGGVVRVYLTSGVKRDVAIAVGVHGQLQVHIRRLHIERIVILVERIIDSGRNILAWQYCSVNQPYASFNNVECGTAYVTESFTRNVETKIELVAGGQIQTNAQQLILLTASAAAYSELALYRAVDDEVYPVEGPGDVPLPAGIAKNIFGNF